MLVDKLVVKMVRDITLSRGRLRRLISSISHGYDAHYHLVLIDNRKTTKAILSEPNLNNPGPYPSQKDSRTHGRADRPARLSRYPS